MKPLSLFIIFLLVYSLHTHAQLLAPSQKLSLEMHPTDKSLVVAKFLSEISQNVEEEWTMLSMVDEFNLNDFNDLVKTRKMVPNGKHYSFYRSGKLFLESNYVFGECSGEITAYYETGEIYYKVNSNEFLEGELIHYYKNGNVKRIENFNAGNLSGKMIEFYTNETIKYKGNYLNGKKVGNFIFYHQNGKAKRKIKYENGNAISEKCFDVNGKALDCAQLHIEPQFPGGVNALKTSIESLNLGSITPTEDTAIFRIILTIDTLGQASLTKYHFKTNPLLFLYLNNWVNQLPAFTPYYFDGVPQKCRVNIAFPIFKNRILWPEETTKTQEIIRDSDLQEEYQTFFWEFTSEIPDHNVYFIADQMPQFPGGTKALRKFISENLNNPLPGKKQNEIVRVSFIVNKQGKLKSFRLMNTVHPLLDEEAFRIAELMPDWIPGKIRNRKVSVYYHVAFDFNNPENKKINLQKTPIIRY